MKQNKKVNGITKLELIKRTDNGKYYWFMDSEYGYFFNSVDFEEIDDAVNALAENRIEWDCCEKINWRNKP